MPFDILFVCTGNTCRSPMAEALLRHALPPAKAGKYHVHSAGLRAGEGLPASEQAIAALREVGIDISPHRSRRLTGALIERADLVLAMTRSQVDEILSRYPESGGRVYLLTDYAARSTDGSSIADPVGGDPEVYRATRDQISAAVKTIAGNM